MTRKEEIVNAADEYSPILCPDAEAIERNNGFVDGALWADEHQKNPWRDAKEDPPKKELDGLACEFVLVPYGNEVREVRYYFSTGTFEKGFLGTSEEEVIYPKVWMPMPSLPKGGES